MRTQDRYSDRRSRGGSRRRGGRGRRSEGYSSRSSVAVAPKKQTLWQKVVAFFTGEKTKTASVSGNGRGERSSRPARPEQRSDRFERSEMPRTVRKPEVVEVTSTKLYVGNLSFDATESDLFELFNGVGKVQNAEIVSHKYTQKSKGFAFVMMTSIDEARRAVSELHDKEFMGRKLVVSGAKTSDVRGGNADTGSDESSSEAA